MEIRAAVLKTIEAVPGAWTVAAAHLGMSPTVLRNRAYETKGWTLSTEHKLALQELSGKQFIVEALCTASGGTFVMLPEAGQVDNDSVQLMFNEVYRGIGDHFKLFMDATKDGEIDGAERRNLQDHGAELHRMVEKLQALMFSVYCRHTNTVRLGLPRVEVANG